MDIQAVKIKIKPEMVGRECLMPITEVSNKNMQKLPLREKLNVDVKKITSKRVRSYEQLELYWALCDLVANNTDDFNWNTKEKVDEQCKIACRLYKHWIYYENQKTGQTTLNIKTDSISYQNLNHLEACNYFSEAFDVMANKLGLSSKEELLQEIR